MAKYPKRDKKRTPKRILLVAAVPAAVLALIAALVLLWKPSDLPDTGEGALPQQTTQMQEPSGTDGEPATEPMETRLPALEFPVVLENGKLEIENLFQYDGINPDCHNEEGKNVASMTMKNLSGAYLAKAEITLTLTDGAVVNFTVNDLSAGKTVMAFSVDNTSMKADALCADAVCIASWYSENIMLPEDLSVDVDGVTITVTNRTGHDISELVIYCRCPLDEEYFGGLAYQYTIDDLPANESATVEALDCILGMAEVIRVAVTQE